MLRPHCYPAPPAAALNGAASTALPLLDVLTSPVPAGRFDSPVDFRHVLCLHLGAPVPVTYRAGRFERDGVRLHGQYCVVPAGSSTRWTLSQPARSLLLRLAPDVFETASALAPTIHVRDPQVEQIAWLMRSEQELGYPSGRLFTDSLASALSARLLSLQTRRTSVGEKPVRALPAWRLRQVAEYIEANLQRDLSLAELAALTGYSPSHFKALFRQAANMPVHQFVTLRRIERARQMLSEARHSITDIAFETGFSHPSHLARALRRHLGMSPSALRAARV